MEIIYFQFPKQSLSLLIEFARASSGVLSRILPSCVFKTSYAKRIKLSIVICKFISCGLHWHENNCSYLIFSFSRNTIDSGNANGQLEWTCSDYGANESSHVCTDYIEWNLIRWFTPGYCWIGTRTQHFSTSLNLARRKRPEISQNTLNSGINLSSSTETSLKGWFLTSHKGLEGRCITVTPIPRYIQSNTAL